MEDLELVLPIISGMDWCDASVVPMPLLDPKAVDLADLQVAFYTADGVSEPAAAVVETVKGAAEALKPAVATIEEARPPGLEQAWPITQTYWESVLQSTMTARAFSALLRRWSRFRSTMLGFMQQRSASAA